MKRRTALLAEGVHPGGLVQDTVQCISNERTTPGLASAWLVEWTDVRLQLKHGGLHSTKNPLRAPWRRFTAEGGAVLSPPLVSWP